MCEQPYWRDNDVFSGKVRFRPQFLMYDVEQILTDQNVSPVLIQSPKQESENGSFTPYQFLRSMGNDRLVFASQTIDGKTLNCRLVLYDVNERRFESGSELDLETSIVFTADKWESGFMGCGGVSTNNVRIDSATYIHGPIEDGSVLQAFRCSELTYPRCNLQELHIRWDELGTPSINVANQGVIPSVPMGFSPDGRRYLSEQMHLRTRWSVKTDVQISDLFGPKSSRSTLRTLDGGSSTTRGLCLPLDRSVSLAC